MWPILYNFVFYPLLIIATRLVALKNDKIKASVIGKKSVWSRFPQTLKNRDFKRKLIWFNAPSAGEFIQLQPLLEIFLKNNFDCIVTYNSISAEKWLKKAVIQASRQPIFLDYLPYDSKRLIRRWLNLIKPDALVFIKYDLWPNTIWETSKAGIPVYLVSATLHEKTKRFVSKIGRSFYRNLYSHFKAIFVVEESDKKRFMITNQTLQHVEVFGDIRYDATLDQRYRKPTPQLPKEIEEKFVFILGSSWPPDEDCVFTALKEAMTLFPDFIAIVAPHEPTDAHLAKTESYFKENGVCRLSQVNKQNSMNDRVILVDSIGILSALYHVGNIGYIGGGFTTGVHNVMEPCAMGLPVFFGPIHYNSGEALQLSKDGLAFPVNNKEEFQARFFELLNDREKIKKLGEQSKQYIENQAGATNRSYQAIAKDLERSDP